VGLINGLMMIRVPTGVAVHAAGFEKAKFKGFPVPTKNGMGRRTHAVRHGGYDGSDAKWCLIRHLSIYRSGNSRGIDFSNSVFHAVSPLSGSCLIFEPVGNPTWN
jgi:hypothetical protein